MYRFCPFLIGMVERAGAPRVNTYIIGERMLVLHDTGYGVGLVVSPQLMQESDLTGEV